MCDEGMDWGEGYHEAKNELRPIIDALTLERNDLLSNASENECTIDALVAALEVARSTIISLADQQAMPDDWYTPHIMKIDAALALARGEV